MYAVFSKYKKDIIVFVCLLVAFISGYLLCAGRDGKLHDDTNRTMGRIEEAMQRTDSRIESVKESNKTAETSAEEAIRAIIDSRIRINEVSNGITEISRTVDHCAERHQRITELVERIEEENRKRAQDTQPPVMAK